MADDAFARKFAELGAAFRAQLPGRIAELNALAAAGDWSTIREVAHQLAGQGGTFGAPGISEAARAVEEAQPAEVADRLVELANAAQAI